MNKYHDEVVMEIRCNRVKLLEMYGGIEGLHKHMEEEKPKLEKEGWCFISAEDFAKQKAVPKPQPVEYK